jgi:tetratricopeptide (TPR) repeat protein
MIHESGARRAPHSGKLRARPLALLLAQANDRGVTGTITVAHAGQRATIMLRAGRILAVRSSTKGPFLGSIVLDLGLTDAKTVDRTFALAARSRKLHGEVLLAEGVLTRAELERALAEQTKRKLSALFDLPDDATFASREDASLVTDARDGDRPTIDPWEHIWRGMKDKKPNEHVQRAIARLDGTISVVVGASLDRLGLDAEARAFCETLRDGGASASRIIATSPLGEAKSEMLLYCLALARAIEVKSDRVEGPRDLGRDGVRALAQRLLDTNATRDPWSILGLRRGASVDAARAAFLRLIRVWRPDRLPHDLVDLASDCVIIYRAMTEAHRVIVEERARHLSLVPPPDARTVGLPTMRDVDAALAKNDLAKAAEIAGALRAAGADGPRARAVLAWCQAGGDAANDAAREEAIATLDRILAGDPDCTRALVYRARFAERLGRLDAARADFRKVLRLDPANADAQMGLRILAVRTFGDEALAFPSVPPPCRPTLPCEGVRPYLVRAK